MKRKKRKKKELVGIGYLAFSECVQFGNEQKSPCNVTTDLRFMPEFTSISDCSNSPAPPRKNKIREHLIRHVCAYYVTRKSCAAMSTDAAYRVSRVIYITLREHRQCSVYDVIRRKNLQIDDRLGDDGSAKIGKRV